MSNASGRAAAFKLSLSSSNLILVVIRIYPTTWQLFSRRKNKVGLLELLRFLHFFAMMGTSH
jgi:hypothetical protein